MLAEYRTESSIGSMSSMYQADVPQYYLNINRDKVQLMDLQLSQVFAALSYYLGQAYVNDFVEFGRIYQVKLGAGEDAQKYIDDVLKLSVENSKGEMVPFNSFVQVEQVLGMDQVPGVFIMMCNGFPYPILTPVIEEIVEAAPDSFKNHAMVKEYMDAARQNMEKLKAER